MIRRLIARLCHVDWRAAWPTEPRGGGPALDRALADDELNIEAAERGLTGSDRAEWIDRQGEARIRADERRRHITQADTAHGQPPLRIGMYFPNGRVPY